MNTPVKSNKPIFILFPCVCSKKFRVFEVKFIFARLGRREILDGVFDVRPYYYFEATCLKCGHKVKFRQPVDEMDDFLDMMLPFSEDFKRGNYEL